MKHPRTWRTVPLAALAALGASIALAAPAAALPASAENANATAVSAEGWVRLGHFSPDTAAVDVRVTALTGGSVVFELSDVGYGDVSTYESLPAGNYTVSMVAAGSDDWSDVALSDTVTVSESTATTVAAYGPTRSLQLRAFNDDLTGPDAGNARIRLIQASTITPMVDVQTSTGVKIASKARAGSASAYTEVPAGSWTLELRGEGIDQTAQVDVAAGSVTTLFVLDTADGGLTVLPVVDSAAVPVTPIGGVQTGGGWLAGAVGPVAPHPVGGSARVAF